MSNNNVKSASAATGRPPAVLRSMRSAIAGPGLSAIRGLRAAPRSCAPAAERAAANRIGAAVTVALSVALLAGGALMVAQIWANLGMIR